MDGYAVRAADAGHGARLRVIGVAAAGRGFRGRVGPGEAVRIFTGAPVPEGADAVLIQEDADRSDEETIIVRDAVLAGRNIRPAGLDFREGDSLLQRGRIMDMAAMAIAAAMNYAAVPVRRRPKVAIVATGDELVPLGGTPGADQIIASNSYGIAALAREAGAVPYDLGIAIDDSAAIGRAIDAAVALPADILVTLGGASVGEMDLVRQTLEQKGMALDFWKIAMRPGRPLMFGRLGALHVLGMPGNPVSSLVCALLFLKPLIGALLGDPYADMSEAAVLGGDLPANDWRQDYLRASLAERRDAPPVATAFPLQDSSMLSTLAAADCLIIRPPLAPPARAGEPCRIVRL